MDFKHPERCQQQRTGPEGPPFKLLRDLGQSLSATEVAQSTGIARPVAYSTLAKLVEKGQLEKIDVNGSPGYKAAQDSNLTMPFENPLRRVLVVLEPKRSFRPHTVGRLVRALSRDPDGKLAC
jgi:hypothetical protein